MKRMYMCVFTNLNKYNFRNIIVTCYLKSRWFFFSCWISLKFIQKKLSILNDGATDNYLKRLVLFCFLFSIGILPWLKGLSLHMWFALLMTINYQIRSRDEFTVIFNIWVNDSDFMLLVAVQDSTLYIIHWSKIETCIYEVIAT